MMFKNISDPHAIEAEEPTNIEGLGFIEDTIIFQKEKVVKTGDYILFGKEIKGFEIHHGTSKKYPLFYEEKKIRGTFVHGLFDDKDFEKYKKETITSFVQKMKERLDIERIMKSI